ncbi:universal stress protein [Pseudobacteriovorax antillogorgiicola]|uniref:Nucleotide-binding universal stress protein, UspA family n=1 Tax=Pseudobacteriovorax antillogorgiicola TaxID=1513793 RepID=A0A1Y6CJQ0_9BACT|nr:universal stress protein [Pseudobacteriovorax antillogorgiicola]TCS47960.1 nucleotide-binding universal stress UspA family protein [Pseudobacteriovorax antillogorgiicola]SMF58173.1 Nucleotide-binding universal stress protein, UspA family [Pseudobacteriovorax antillogorgiicola]
MEAEHRFVLSCIDGSSNSDAVCDYGAWMARMMSSPLKLIHAVEHQYIPAVADLSGAIGLGSQTELLNELTTEGETRRKFLIEQGKKILQAGKQRCIDSGTTPIETIQRHGSILESLVELEPDVKMIVVGIRGQDHEQKSGIGTQLETMIRSIHRPILVVNKAFTAPKASMLAYDGSDNANKALNMIASNLAFKDIPCHIVHVGKQGSDLLDKASKVLTDVGIKTTTKCLDGKIEDALSDYQIENDIDVMLMGAFSHTRVRGLLLGSFTAKMLAKTNRPLFLLR